MVAPQTTQVATVQALEAIGAVVGQVESGVVGIL